MVNSTDVAGLAPVRRVVAAYVALAVGTVVAVIVLSSTTPRLATSEAWGHAVIVAAFAVLLPFRLRAAGRGGVAGLRAVTIIGCVLLVVNVVEAALPGVFPLWMRIEMVVIAALMATLVVLAVRAHRIRGRVAGDPVEQPQ